MDLYMVNPLDPKTDRQVARLEGESWGAYDWSPDDHKVILTEFKSVNESYLWMLDLQTKSKKLITPANSWNNRFFRSVESVDLLTKR